MIKKKITNQSERIVVVNKYHSNYDFYIGRGSVLGNPYPITDTDSRDSVCNKYEVWFEQNKDRPDVKEYLNKILAKARLGSVSLGCFCKPQRCHGDTIKQWLDQQLGVSFMSNNQMDCVPSFRNELAFLSNMYLCRIHSQKYGEFICAESAYQAMKCMNISEVFRFKHIDGYEAKKLGRQVKLRSDWDEIKLSIMEEILREKFQGELLQKLLTIKGEIVERNNWGDTYWGVCNGKGQNQLGKLLMKIRDENLGVSVMKNLNDTQTLDMFEKTKSMTYAGIGSRETPVAVMKVMTEIAQLLEKSGYRLYSGAAEGADSAFAWNTANKIEFIPWNGFNGCKSGVIATSDKAMKLAESLHPAWDRLSQGAKKLMARNCHQILGEDLNSPVDFVLCWTPDGAETKTTINTGGTGQAIRLAIKNQIPVINMFNTGWESKLEQLTGIKYIPTINRNSETFKALMTG